jgi:hypothetical protein
VHHAQNERYIDRNYGGMLILWDRLFGTFEDEAPDEPVIFGVRKPLANWNPFWANLQVYDYLLFDARHTRRWRDKIGVWFRRTGWRPADVAAQYPKQNIDRDNFRKFDPVIPPGQRHYVMAQFLAGIVLALVISVLYARDGSGAVLLPCLLLWVQLYAIGLLSEGRNNALAIEWVRLVVVVPLACVIMVLAGNASGFPVWGWWLVAGYSGLSALWLARLPRTGRPQLSAIKQ